MHLLRLPKNTAPENFAWDCDIGCTDCPNSCYVKKQPENDTELTHMIEAMCGSEVENIRYCGTNPDVIQRLREAGLAHLCDVLKMPPYC